jgi:hypothetical protein
MISVIKSSLLTQGLISLPIQIISRGKACGDAETVQRTPSTRSYHTIDLARAVPEEGHPSIRNVWTC